jgi:hypothetical protein
MPVITSAQSVELVPLTRGQRIFTYRPDMMFNANQKFYINIQPNFFEFKITEDVQETAFGVENILVDYGCADLSSSTYVVFSAPDMAGGSLITAMPVIEDGTIKSLTITNTGSGYIYQPTCSVIDPANLNNQSTASIQLLYQIDNSTAEQTTTTYVRGQLSAGIQKFKQGSIATDQTLFALECDVITVEPNTLPQMAGFDLTQFPYLNKTRFISTSTVGQTVHLWSINRFVPVFNRTSAHKTLSVELNPAVQGQKTATRVPTPLMFFMHDKSFTSLQELSWQFLMNTQTPTDYIYGPSASEWDPGVIASQMSTWSGVQYNPKYSLIEDIWCVVPSGPVAAGDPVSVEVHTHPSIQKLYVEQVVGIPDRLEVTLTNGTGTFKILTTTLEPGEVASAKVGFKYWTNAETVEKTLS